jgi:hypothetical protein
LVTAVTSAPTVKFAEFVAEPTTNEPTLNVEPVEGKVCAVEKELPLGTSVTVPVVVTSKGLEESA